MEENRIQIVSVELQASDQLTCVVRCVGGVVRVGQNFAPEHQDDREDAVRSLLTLEQIDRYGRSVEFFDAPHGAKISLSVNEPSVDLEVGMILHSVP